MIRPYNPADYPVLKEWMDVPEHTFPIDSTYIAEHDELPAVSLSVYFTNDPAFALLENFLGDPGLDKQIRRGLSEALVQHVEAVSRSRGVTRLVCIAPHQKLENRYRELGYGVVLENVSCLAKEL